MLKFPTDPTISLRIINGKLGSNAGEIHSGYSSKKSQIEKNAIGVRFNAKELYWIGAYLFELISDYGIWQKFPSGYDSWEDGRVAGAVPGPSLCIFGRHGHTQEKRQRR